MHMHWMCGRTGLSAEQIKTSISQSIFRRSLNDFNRLFIANNFYFWLELVFGGADQIRVYHAINIYDAYTMNRLR